MILDKKMKMKLIAALAIATLAGSLIIISLFRTSVLSSHLWRLSIGSVAIILGATLCYVIMILPFDIENKRLKFAIIANPGVAGILSGFAVILWDSTEVEWLFYVCSYGAVISFIISFVLLRKHFITIGKMKQ